MAYNECATRKRWTGSQISLSYGVILESNRIHLFLFSGTMKIMNTLQLVFVLMIPPSAFVYQLLQNRCICVSTRQKLRSEMAQHLREDGIPIDPWLHGWWVDGPKMVQVSTVFPVKFPWKKRCALQNTSISQWLIYFSASFLCARQNFRGVVDLLKLLNQSKTAKIHRISRWDVVNHPRTFSSAPRLDLSLTFVEAVMLMIVRLQLLHCANWTGPTFL